MANVTIYTTPTCAFCHMTKEFFKAHDVEYQEKDVTQDQQALHDMVQKSGQMGVPVIDVDGAITVGFNQPRLSQLLHI